MGRFSSIHGSSNKSSGGHKEYKTKSGMKITQSGGKISFTKTSKTPRGTRVVTHQYKDKYAK